MLTIHHQPDPVYTRTLPLTEYGQRRMRELTYSWTYRFPEGGRLIPRALGIIAPASTIIDGASVPRMFISALAPDGLLYEASIPHDIAYKTGELTILTAEGSESWIHPDGRLGYDRLFYDMAVQMYGDMKLFHAAYWAVRWGGRRVWNSRFD